MTGVTVRPVPPRPVQVLLLTWATLSFVVSLLPVGVGGAPRAVNAVVFLTLGPAVALMAILLPSARRRTERPDDSPDGAGPRQLPVFSPGLTCVLSIAVSLVVLVFSSQVLLLLGWWAVWSVAAVVTLVTVALLALPMLLLPMLRERE